jgi:hypothetical protein
MTSPPAQQGPGLVTGKIAGSSAAAAIMAAVGHEQSTASACGQFQPAHADRSFPQVRWPAHAVLTTGAIQITGERLQVDT